MKTAIIIVLAACVVVLAFGWRGEVVARNQFIRDIEKLTNHLDNAKGYIEQVNEEYDIEPFGFVSNIYSEDMCTVTQLAVNYFDEEVLFYLEYSWTK